MDLSPDTPDILPLRFVLAPSGRKKEWDRNQWFGHTERAMLLLRQPQYYRHGYVRGFEPVQ